MAVILDAASGVAFCDPEVNTFLTEPSIFESQSLFLMGYVSVIFSSSIMSKRIINWSFSEQVIQTALLVLVNLVCPPPSLCSRPMPNATNPAASQQAQSSQGGAGNGVQANTVGAATAVNLESKGWTGRAEPNVDRNGSTPAAPGPGTYGAAVVGDRRISLGPGAGGSGLAAYMEQGYRYAREAVRSNNGIKVLLHLLYPRTVLPPAALDCIRALSCRVLLGLARDEAIAHILTKLQVYSNGLFL